MRRCKQCKEVELRPVAKCQSIIEKKGYCSVECLADHTAQKRMAKEAKEAISNDKWRKSIPKSKRELDRNNLKWQEGRTQESFNKMRLLQEKLWFYERGIEPYCISCQKTKMDFCCGHNKTRGSNSYLQFDEKNTFMQCNTYCNSKLSGNINGNSTSIGYLKGLRLRFGDKEGQKIIDYCETSPTSIKRTVEDFERLRKSYNKKSRDLKQKVEDAKFIFEHSKS